MKLRFSSVCSIVVSVMLLAACGGAPATPIAPPTVVPTAAPISAQQLPTATSAAPEPTTATRPTPAPQPTVAPTPTASISSVEALDAQAPLLIYPVADGLMAAQADGASKTLISDDVPTPDRNLSDGLAPHGGLLAFRSGDNPLTPDQEGVEPLMLNLFDAHAGTTKPITRMFSPDMEQAIKAASTTGDRTAAVEAAIATIENEGTLAWSPDGRHLAFIAAIDGPSSDLYSYDRETGQINRLTDGPNQAARLFWSPDSQWIIHEEVENFGTGAGWNVKAVWAAAPDGSGNRKLYDTEQSSDEVFVAWVSPDTFLVYSWTPIGLQNIRLVDLDTGEAQRIGPEFPVQALAFDPESQTQLTMVDADFAQQDNLQSGLYLTSPAASQPQLIAPGNWYNVRWWPQVKLFFAQGEEGVLSVALDGTMQRYHVENALPSAAPDGAWLIAWGDGNYTSPIGLRLYTRDGELSREITPDSVAFATWSPDATGVFYVSDGSLYYASIPNGEPQLIEESLTSSEPSSVGWVIP